MMTNTLSKKSNDELSGSLLDSLDKANDDQSIIPEEEEDDPYNGDSDTSQNDENANNSEMEETKAKEELKALDKELPEDNDKELEEEDNNKAEQEVSENTEEEALAKAKAEEQAKKLEQEALMKKKAEEEAKNLEEWSKKQKQNELNEAERIRLSYQTANPQELNIRSIPLSSIHQPVSIKEYKKSSIWAIATLVIFSCVYLWWRIPYNYLKNYNKFFSKTIASLANQILLWLMCYFSIILFYIYGTFDSIPINWEYLISGIAIFLIIYFVFGSSVIIISIFNANQWEKWENNSKSFKDIRHRYDVIANIKYDKDNIDKVEGIRDKENNIIENFEYLVLKRFLFLPLFPLFKSSSLHKEMKFNIYLEKCLIYTLRRFFKFTWTSWFLWIIVMLFWNVYIVTGSILTVTIVSMTVPIIGIIISCLLWWYMNYIYRRVVEQVTQNSMANYQDVEYNSSSVSESMGYPRYIFEMLQSEEKCRKFSEKKFTFVEHFHQRPASIYEDNILLGNTGIVLIWNTTQACSVIFICWFVVFFAKHYSYIIIAYSYYSLFFIIPFVILYFCLQTYLTATILKWFTIIDSIEMKRNEKCIRKLNNYHLKEAGKISEEIYIIFKRIYFDMMNNKLDKISDEDKLFLENEEKENAMKLGYRNFQNVIRAAIARYTHSNKEDVSIDIATDLLPFLKTMGNSLNEKDITFMLHLMDNFKNFKGRLNADNIFDIYGAILYFRQEKPLNIVRRVFENYYNANPQLYRNVSKMTYGSIELFINTYQNFFTEEQIQFIKDESTYLGEMFSLDTLMTTILSFRQYYPY